MLRDTRGQPWCRNFGGMDMTTFYIAAVVFYCLAAFVHLLWAKGVVSNARAGKLFLVVGFLFHTMEIGFRAHAIGAFPIINPRTTYVFFSWCVVLIYGANLIRHRFEVLSFFTVILTIVFILPASFMPDGGMPPGRPALRNWVTALHITLSILSYAMFCLAALAASGYVFEHWRLKKKRKDAVLLKLPPLETLDVIQTRMVRCGAATLGLGILSGYCWAWREGWRFISEPKVLVTIGIFACYVAMAVSKQRAQVSSRLYAVGIVIMSVLCIISLYAVNVGPQHTF